MNQRIIYPTDDGGVAVIIPAPDCGLTIEQIAAKDVLDVKPYKIVDTADIPTDRTFRGAWEQSGKTIAHNLDKCKGIAHDLRRADRAKKMAPHDVEATIPAKAAAAEAAREAIRQSNAKTQNAIDAATTPDGIKAALSA